LLQSVPAKWEKYTNFVLFPEDAFRSDTWSSLLNITVLADLIDGQKYAASSVSATASDVFFAAVAELLGASHLARKAPIPVNDVMRRPIIDVLFGDWGNWRNSSRYELDDSLDTTDFEQAFWAQAKQNQVIYHWAPIHTMFCPGNISEKLRVAQSPHYRCLPHQVVVDLYAGVGYFTLPYLLHAGAATVHACELNPWSVEGLRRGARASHLSYRIHGNPPVPAPSSAFLKGESPRLIIYPGDNAAHVHHYEKVAHHVNLGLLPSSEAGWPLAVRALRTEGGILHVHTNARADELAEWLDHLRSRLGQLLAHWKTASSWMVSVLHVERVKSFAPLVYHYVVDVECRPNLQENLSVPLG
ncbi:S-adenosyl-L-methionine-dependent methyltransferase, partial [Dimargaris cristalligena]